MFCYVGCSLACKVVVKVLNHIMHSPITMKTDKVHNLKFFFQSRKKVNHHKLIKFIKYCTQENDYVIKWLGQNQIISDLLARVVKKDHLYELVTPIILIL